MFGPAPSKLTRSEQSRSYILSTTVTCSPTTNRVSTPPRPGRTNSRSLAKCVVYQIGVNLRMVSWCCGPCFARGCGVLRRSKALLRADRRSPAASFYWEKLLCRTGRRWDRSALANKVLLRVRIRFTRESHARTQ
ncbi:hypothetical protein BC628DRAFT_287118 [Trametes gibbosa]|nr:hypothetical protein BC628DRAFT_287118 [Trametes gibbosa]